MRGIQILTKFASSLLIGSLFASVIAFGKHDNDVETYLEEPAPWFYQPHYLTHTRPWHGDKVVVQHRTGGPRNFANRAMYPNRARA